MQRGRVADLARQILSEELDVLDGSCQIAGLRGEIEIELDDDDMEGLAGREIFELARSLHDGPLDLLPTSLLQRLSTVNAQLVTSIAAPMPRVASKSMVVVSENDSVSLVGTPGSVATGRAGLPPALAR